MITRGTDTGGVHAMLPRQGLGCALRTVQRVRQHAGLQITGPAVKPKTPPRPKAKIKSDGVNDVWYVDVVFDTTQHGTMVKFLTLLDEYSHFNFDIVASRRMGNPHNYGSIMSYWLPIRQSPRANYDRMSEAPEGTLTYKETSSAPTEVLL